jgi:TonB family protein
MRDPAGGTQEESRGCRQRAKETMASSGTFLEPSSSIENRRACARLPLGWVVLVYFGENNWGKLWNVNENGMCLEFAEPMRTGQHIRFSMESIGRLPMTVEGDVASEKLAVAGEIKWIREFERTAGVHFTELNEESRNLIEEWLSSKAHCLNQWRDNQTKPKREDLLCQTDLQPKAETLDEAQSGKLDLDGTAAKLEKAECSVEPVGTLEPRLVEKILEAPTFEAYSRVMAEEQCAEPVPVLNNSGKWMPGNGLLAVLACLGLLAIVAGLRMIRPVWERKSEAAERAPGHLAVQQSRANAKNISSASEAQPFLVEVQDAANRRWLLWFDHNSTETVSVPATSRPSEAYSRASASRAAGPTRPSVTARLERQYKYSLARPQLNHSKPNGLSEPPLSASLLVPSEAPPLDSTFAGILASETRPEPAIRSLPSFVNEVQPARLIKADPPVYPALAKANRINGEVTLDALIDTTGRVTDVKVVNGPNLLRAAATEALRSWKYEPARLRGLAVPTRLNVTVKFHYE